MALFTCPDCGGKISSDALQCPHCGKSNKSMTDRQKPDSYLVYSILSTLFCCLPLGIVGIVNATKVDPAWNAGRYDEAQRYADTAKVYDHRNCYIAHRIYCLFHYCCRGFRNATLDEIEPAIHRTCLCIGFNIILYCRSVHVVDTKMPVQIVDGLFLSRLRSAACTARRTSSRHS